MTARHFNVRSRNCTLREPMARYSSGFLREREGVRDAVSDDAVIEAALRILAARVASSSALSNPRVTREYLTVRFAGLEHEVFTCVYLDNRHRVIACEDLFRGTIDGAGVHPREVVKSALKHNAAAVILAHNHPSGVAEPSQADELITQRLKQALGLIDIRVLDHLIVGDGVCESFAERGLL
jgi:DNA repair protein RadC